MNWDRVKENWGQYKYKVKERWSRLTQDDIEQIEGRLDRLSQKIQERYKKKKEQVEDEVEEFSDECSEPAMGMQGREEKREPYIPETLE